DHTISPIFVVAPQPPMSTLFPTRRSSDLRIHDVADDDDGGRCHRETLGRLRDISEGSASHPLIGREAPLDDGRRSIRRMPGRDRSEEHTSELQSRENLVCRLLLEKKNKA